MRLIQQLTNLNFILISLFCFPSMNDLAHGNQLLSFLNTKNYLAEENLSIVVEPSNCPVWGTCNESPALHFYVEGLSADTFGYELDIEIGDQIYSYPEMDIVFPLPFTTSEGVTVKYYLINMEGSFFSMGEFSYRLSTLSPETNLYQIEMIGDRWVDSIPSYAYSWKMFSPIEDVDYSWAVQYESPLDLATQNDFALLAGKLIWSGSVDASSCYNNGLETSGAANQCGMDASREQVITWQNTHDTEILQAGNVAFIPPRLIKGTIAVESQFWPTWEIEGEYGLGMLTEDGMDMLLKWNPSYFYEKCTNLYLHDLCKYGYYGLKDKQLTSLIGYVMKDIGTEREYRLIAETIKAATLQTSQLIQNYTNHFPNEVADFETLWRITLGIYHAGCGCMGTAIKESWKESSTTLTWSRISNHLTGTCAGAIDYFDKIVETTR